MPKIITASDEGNTKATREIEVYRCWPGNAGDSGTWDTGFVDIPVDVDIEDSEALQAAVKKAVMNLLRHSADLPVIVGVYCIPAEEEEEEEEEDEES